jgi:hypothetical protein
MAETLQPKGLQGAKLAAMGTIAAILVVLGLVTTAPRAEADSLAGFCAGWRAPYGQPGDRCDQNQAYAAHYAGFRVFTKERAGCVRALGYYGEPVTSWVCAPRESEAYVNLPDNKGFYRGSLRNNNTNYPGYFYGWTICCYSPNQ